jgi:hypothetical protein
MPVFFLVSVRWDLLRPLPPRAGRAAGSRTHLPLSDWDPFLGNGTRSQRNNSSLAGLWEDTQKRSAVMSSRRLFPHALVSALLLSTAVLAQGGGGGGGGGGGAGGAGAGSAGGGAGAGSAAGSSGSSSTAPTNSTTNPAGTTGSGGTNPGVANPNTRSLDPDPNALNRQNERNQNRSPRHR